MSAVAVGLIVRGAQTQPLPRGPYLQSVTQDSVWVVWDTVTPTVGSVAYGVTEVLEQQVVESTAALHHEVQLTGLAPGRAIYYRVDDAESTRFHTAPAAGAAAFRFVVYGDTRTNATVHQQIVGRILEVQPDLLIHTGDMVANGQTKTDWDRFFAIEAPLLRTAPFYPVLGNHEYYEPGAYESLYTDVFRLPGNELWYAFDYGNARFVVLKADGRPADAPLPDAAQMAWLEQALSSNTAPWLFVVLHRGPFTSRDEGRLEVGLREQLVPLFEQYGVDAVFSGHDHSYERISNSGITYIVTAGGGGPLYALKKPEPGSQAAVRAYHFVEIDVVGESLTGTAIDRDGAVIDRFTLQADR